MIIEISQLPLADLQQLLVALPKEIEKRRAQERALVREELAALARARGFNLDDLLASPQFTGDPAAIADSGRTQRRPAPVKYRHPLQAELAWSGRGKTPRWINAWIAEGKTMAELAVS